MTYPASRDVPRIDWIPAFAGMTGVEQEHCPRLIYSAFIKMVLRTRPEAFGYAVNRDSRAKAQRRREPMNIFPLHGIKIKSAFELETVFAR